MTKKYEPDCSYPREHAESKLRSKGESLDELARRLSIDEPHNPVTVRDIHTNPISHSAVFLLGERIDAVPWLKRGVK